eukprot:11420967-Prorocentrum_lima.AAC.1
MTSSLVGSEMCIRDSINCDCMPFGPIKIQPLPVGHMISSLSPRPVAVSVSYTHLTLPTICSV